MYDCKLRKDVARHFHQRSLPSPLLLLLGDIVSCRRLLLLKTELIQFAEGFEESLYDTS